MSRNKSLLLSLGLNDLEAEVYMALLQEEGLTGYKIGKLLRKPTANVYKALESLAVKGAAISEDQENSHFQATPLEDLCDLMEAATLRKIKETKENFDLPKKEIVDERSYQIQSPDLVIEKSKKMLRSCKFIAMLDVFPGLLNPLLNDIRAAVNRGIEVYLQVYSPVEIEGVKVVLIDISPKVLEYWKSEQLNLVIDGKEHLLALLSQDLKTVYQATWSRNLYLSSMFHMGFHNHYTIFKIRELQKGDNFYTQVQKIIQDQGVLSNGNIPGVGELLKRHGLQ